jgi:ribosomal protein S27AE
VWQLIRKKNHEELGEELLAVEDEKFRRLKRNGIRCGTEHED